MAPGSMPHVAVVGAGIIGSSIAANLAQRGCKVTVLEAGPQPAEGATAKTWAWLNANRKSPSHYRGDTRENDPAYPSKALDKAQIRSLEPEIAADCAAAGGRLFEQEGYGYAATAATAFLDDAKANGAELLFSEEVTGFSSSDGRTTGVQTNRKEHKADVVILAAGLNVPKLAKHLNVEVPLSDKPGTLTILTQPMPRFLDHIVVTETAFIMQRRDGEVMISFFKAAVNHSPTEKQDRPAESLDHGIASRVAHSAEEAERGHQKEAYELLNESDEIAEQEIARAAKVIPALEYASLSTLSVAKYPYPADAHPIVGWLPGQDNVYVAVTHSGATLGPLLGRLVAEEILGNKQEPLKHYRPDRDFSSTEHLY